MVKKRKNLTDSAHGSKMMHSVSELSRQISFDSSRRNAFTPRLPELRNIHIFRRNEIEYNAVPNIHGYYVLWICLAGTGRLLIDGAHVELQSGESTLVLPGQPHIRLPDAEKRHVSWLLIRFESDDHGWFAGFRNARSRLSPETSEKLAMLLEYYLRREEILYSSACGGTLLLLLSLLLTEQTDFSAKNPLYEPDIPGGTASCIRELCELMMQMPPVGDPFRIVAARRNVTAAYLHVLFRKKTGHTPRDFMARQKLNLAQHLLANSDLTISEIALRCGFSGIYPFSRFFSRKCRITPTAYRKERNSQHSGGNFN
jgi:hypothetical protein